LNHYIIIHKTVYEVYYTHGVDVIWRPMVIGNSSVKIEKMDKIWRWILQI